MVMSNGMHFTDDSWALFVDAVQRMFARTTQKVSVTGRGLS
jgi:hypothetical protein